MPKNTLLLGAVAVSLAGCQQYLARQDLIEPWSGDAVAHNLALQTIDPWPRHAYDTHIPTSGRRQATAIRKYQAWGEETPQQELAPVQLVVQQPQ
jgi:hypothetical protein